MKGSKRHSGIVGDERLAWAFVLPALVLIASIAIFPLAWTVWESLHLHDLRMPWLGRPFVGLSNYREAFSDARFWAALGHTVLFVVLSVSLELVLGMALALALNEAYAGRGLVRTAVLLPWAVPTVVTALLWAFMFDAHSGIVNRLLSEAGIADGSFVWFVRPLHDSISLPAAWIPIVLADVWKMTPFVTLLLLAGLQSIDESLYEAARMDGAGAVRRFVHITVPLLRPAVLVVLVFRSLDSVRVFDLIYVMTKGGPGTATEPISLHAFNSLLNNLRFGYGSAISVVIFIVTMGLALLYVWALGDGLAEEELR